MAVLFDPNAAATGDGIFGLPYTTDEAACVLFGVPFDATTSYRAGASQGPDAILAASRQVDLWDLDLGRPYEPGIALLPVDEALRQWNREARAAAEPVIEAGGVGDDVALQASAHVVNQLSDRLNDWVYAQTKALLEADKIPGLLGGDHAVPFGAIRAAAQKHPGLGVLHVDAHADLRDAYEGFTWSHASIMHNVATRLPGVSRIVQVGIRDFCEQEHRFIQESRGRIHTFFDLALARERAMGASWMAQTERIVEALPREVWISFDIDGLDPALCPNTGTPVPGGLGFNEAVLLIQRVARSGRRIVGFDLNEVAPGPDGDEWDANVAAHLLYRMIGWTFASRGLVRERAL